MFCLPETHQLNLFGLLAVTNSNCNDSVPFQSSIFNQKSLPCSYSEQSNNCRIAWYGMVSMGNSFACIGKY